jgi:hypothetical protein
MLSPSASLRINSAKHLQHGAGDPHLHLRQVPASVDRDERFLRVTYFWTLLKLYGFSKGLLFFVKEAFILLVVRSSSIPDQVKTNTVEKRSCDPWITFEF